MAKLFVFVVLTWSILLGFQQAIPADSNPDLLGKVYCCRFDCPAHGCGDRPRGCYYIEQDRCAQWIGFGNARQVNSCDECSFPRQDF